MKSVLVTVDLCPGPGPSLRPSDLRLTLGAALYPESLGQGRHYLSELSSHPTTESAEAPEGKIGSVLS